MHGSGTQINGNTRLESFEQVVVQDQEGGDESFELHDVLSCDAEDPSVAVARKLDWQAFLADLPANERAVVEFLVEGASGSAIARKLKTTDSKIQTIKHRLAKAIVAFMGADILIEVRRSPKWKDCIMASRERLPCRAERRHL